MGKHITDTTQNTHCKCTNPLKVAGDKFVEDYCGRCYKDLKKQRKQGKRFNLK